MLYVGVEKQCDEETEDQWLLDHVKQSPNDNQSNQKVIRKFINSAIYVEKPLAKTVVSNESLATSRKLSAEDLLDCVKTKRCTCSVEKKTCPCHTWNNLLTFIPKDETKRMATAKLAEHKTKVSQASHNYSNDSKDLVIKNWIAKKEAEKKKKESNEKMLIEAKLKEKETLIEQERDNFKKWLMNKKKLEADTKKKKQEELEKQQLKHLEKEKRQLENQLNFQLWLKRKEEENLEKKIKKQVDVIDELERKEKQLVENKKAFEDWLKNSKNKQKPPPMNRGIESLCSSTWVSYVNPNPWNPVP